jgi:hypothetical protein
MCSLSVHECRVLEDARHFASPEGQQQTPKNAQQHQLLDNELHWYSTSCLLSSSSSALLQQQELVAGNIPVAMHCIRSRDPYA